MKLPKYRSNVFVVEREVGGNYTVIGVFATYEGASNFAGSCEQDFKERGFTDDDFVFDVKLSTYYDE